jgi:hypothetical protein
MESHGSLMIIFVFAAALAHCLLGVEGSDQLPLCTDASIRQYPCKSNDTYCGDWNERVYTPNNCRYRDVTPEQARKCVGNRTLAFIGDTIIRDIGVGVALFLSGERVETAPDVKFERRKYEKEEHWKYASVIGKFKSWKSNREGYNGLLFPHAHDTWDGKESTESTESTEGHSSENNHSSNHSSNHSNYEWQVQVWHLDCNDLLLPNIHSVLSNKVARENPHLRRIDFAFWEHGLHDQGWWNSPPYGENFFNSIVKQWIEVRSQVPTPVVWVSMNEMCVDTGMGMKPPSLGHDIPPQTQADMVTEGNYVTAQKLRQMGLPLWDASRPLRSPDNCAVQGDGVHVKMWVDLVRAKMLFNHLCDEEFNWVGDVSMF